jgi:hypothetical protein
MASIAPPTVRAVRGWNRPVRPVALIVVGSSLLLIWLVLMTASVWYFYEHWEARLTLNNQRVALRLPAGMPAMAEVTSPLRSRIDLQPLVHVPIHQTVSARFDDQLQARAQLHTVLLIDTSVTLDQLIPVHTTLTLDVPLRSWLPRINVTLPVTLNLPVHMVVPVKAQVPVDLDVLVSGKLPEKLDIPIHAMFDLRPQVRGDIEARMLTQTEFRLVSPVAPFDLSIEHAHLRVPFNLTVFKRRLP